YPTVAAVRGRGLLWAVELADRAAAGRLVASALARGLLLLAGGPDGNVAQIVPPLTVTDEQLETALDLLEESLAAP
ncbi:MAG TPA: aminotransferase class III-fold pyridoxal phosphate-dependent enzyme, partial [Thermoanaerobaculia bacterium]|nr:aminotransferase class III-fold pyridoxal phosphate-dependent enzyme [Thermoanaerobaculia bacterium]